MAAGVGLAAGAYFLSDQRLKQNITILPQSEYDIVNLTGMDWKWTETAREKFGLDNPGRGVIAQEVEKFYPWAVVTGSDGFKRVNYKLLGQMIREAKEAKKLKVGSRRYKE